MPLGAVSLLARADLRCARSVSGTGSRGRAQACWVERYHPSSEHASRTARSLAPLSATGGAVSRQPSRPWLRPPSQYFGEPARLSRGAELTIADAPHRIPESRRPVRIGRRAP